MVAGGVAGLDQGAVHPEEVAVDHGGNIFVDNSRNHIMRQIPKMVYVETLVELTPHS